MSSSTDNSIGIWWKPNEKVKVHLDVNIWYTQDHKDNYLEFGLRIKNYTQISAMYIHIPYEISEDDIEDKAKILFSDNELANAMFNEQLKIGSSSGSFRNVEFINDPIKNFVSCEMNKNDFYVKSNTINLIIKHEPHGSTNSDTIYYRFRINKVAKIFTEVKENYFWLDGLFKKIGFIEVNINSVRGLPSHIVDTLCKISFDSLNLFIMTDNFTTFIFNSRDVKKSRILENHIWKKYLSEASNKNIKKIVAYHWYKEDKKDDSIIPFKDYSLFVKLSYTTKNLILLSIMILMIVAMGTVGGIIGNYVTTKCFNGFVETPVNQNNKGVENGTKSNIKK